MKLSALKISFFFLLISSGVSASKIAEAFEALSIHDYFKARKLFYSINKKRYDHQACYGLAVIFNRNNNPFYNVDSATKFIHISLNYLDEKAANPQLSGFSADRANIQQLLDSIALKQLNVCLLENSIKAYDDFLSKNYLANERFRNTAILNRDELEYNQILAINKSDSTRLFMILHPASKFRNDAFALMERQIFEELTSDRMEESYIRFISEHQTNSNINNAYDALLELYKTSKNKNGVDAFIKNYPNAHHRTEAWQLLFTLSVKTFSKPELESFISNYPDFPFKNSILKEMQLNDLTLIPIEVNERVGFADTTGKILIKPIYDDVSDFSEGLSIVHLGDSVFYVNKDNENTLGRIFADALPFHNGLAPVKVKDKWFLVDRLGEIKSEAYDEVNELSEDLYVIKQNNLYCAINEYGQKIFPCKYDKLGVFTNGCAYYQLDNKYGFVSKSGYVHKPEFDWISDFGNNALAISKINNKFGLINSGGKIVLEPKYDLIQLCAQDIYVLVINDHYGFYSGKGCALTDIIYDYEKERSIKTYSDGKFLKVVKKKQEGLMDLNGKMVIDLNSFQEINFISNGLMRVKKNNKYGYLDKKMAVAIQPKYISAGDFEDGVALVATKKTRQLINLKGEILIEEELKIEKVANGYYLLETQEGNLIADQKGKQLYSGIDSYETYGKYLIIYLENGEIKIVKP